MRDGQLVTDGGRVLTVTAMAPELATAVDAAYEAAEMIEFEGRQFRRDIARRALGQSRCSRRGWNRGAAGRRAGRLSDRDFLCDRRRRVFAGRAGATVSVEGARAGTTGRTDRGGRRDGIFGGARNTNRSRGGSRHAFWPGPLTIVLPARDGICAGTDGTRRRRRPRIAESDCARAQRGTRHGRLRRPART